MASISFIDLAKVKRTTVTFMKCSKIKQEENCYQKPATRVEISLDFKETLYCIACRQSIEEKSNKACIYSCANKTDRLIFAADLTQEPC